ncbi:hypothetical protein F0562_021221 [Nyssa sinensis]|uniref:Uncharacterized protein n=1 Tax=Nyssa sinensis TaxID=561372 RepID=A0A5J5BKL9_9ASTE|nr:hypothetical protein F0562_021221 [Nyssa sinensis]
MAVVEARPVLSTSVFDQGNLAWQCIPVAVGSSSNASSPPKSMLIVAPTLPGTYPVLLFFPGTCLKNTCYRELYRHICSHGYIVVAPQLYKCMLVWQELDAAAEVTKWLPKGLQTVLPPNVEANLDRLALAGHSRGGNAAFTVALDSAETGIKFSALIGLDPVAGPCVDRRMFCPKILNYIPRSFNLKIPVAVIGSGLGDQKKWGMISPPCPHGMNHCEFFAESKPPCCYFRAKDYGHMDVLDDGAAWMQTLVCECGKGPRDPMRRCVGGIFVAFLNAYLGRQTNDLKAIVCNPGIAPIVLDPVIFIEAENHSHDEEA